MPINFLPNPRNANGGPGSAPPTGFANGWRTTLDGTGGLVFVCAATGPTMKLPTTQGVLSLSTDGAFSAGSTWSLVSANNEVTLNQDGANRFSIVRGVTGVTALTFGSDTDTAGAGVRFTADVSLGPPNEIMSWEIPTGPTVNYRFLAGPDPTPELAGGVPREWGVI